MLTMQLSLHLDAQKFIQQLQFHNQMVEDEVQKGLDKAFEGLAKDGEIERMIHEAVKKNVLDSFSRWVFQSDIRKKVESLITQKLSAKIDTYTDNLVNELSVKMNLPTE